MPESPKMTYLPELDGLRAVAILAVLVFHFEPGWLQGGFLGVDMFFVLSGYLITRKIQPQILAGTFSFREFYAGRARRLLPVFLITLLLTWVGAWWLLLPNELKSLSSSTLAALSGWVNYQFSRRLDYFSPDLSAHPLLHTWSLAVEEQFYFLFPLLLMLGRRWVKVRWMVLGLGVMMLTSWLLGCFMPAYAFFALESRAWELGVGCLTAQLSLPGGFSAGKKAVLAWGGLIACLSSFVLLSESAHLPCPAALPVTLGTALLIVTRCAGPESWLHRGTTFPPLRYLGRISYSLYLLHWPLLVFAQKLALEWGAAEKGLALSLCGLLTILVHHLIENPIRRTTARKPLFRLAGLAAALWVGFAAFSYHARQQEGRIQSPGELALKAVLPEYAAKKPETARWLTLGKAERPPDVLLVGDSHAQCLIQALDEALATRGLSGRAWVAHATLPLISTETSEHSEELTQKVIPEILLSPARRVILCASWSSYLKAPKSGWRDRSQQITPHHREEEASKCVEKALGHTLQKLTEAGKEVLLVDPIPSYQRHIPDYLIKHQRLGISPTLELGTPAEHAHRHQIILALFDHAARDYPKVERLDSANLLMKEGRLIYHLEGLSLYEDNSHLSRFGAGFIVPHLLPQQH